MNRLYMNMTCLPACHLRAACACLRASAVQQSAHAPCVLDSWSAGPGFPSSANAVGRCACCLVCGRPRQSRSRRRSRQVRRRCRDCDLQTRHVNRASKRKLGIGILKNNSTSLIRILYCMYTWVLGLVPLLPLPLGHLGTTFLLFKTWSTSRSLLIRVA